jgi:hypothetical protein
MYDQVWSMNAATYRKFLEIGAKGKGFDLDRIPGIKQVKMSARTAIMMHQAIEPLDWDASEFRDELREPSQK